MLDVLTFKICKFVNNYIKKYPQTYNSKNPEDLIFQLTASNSIFKHIGIN